MIRSLFARLTGEQRRGEALFGLAVAEARRPHWYQDGGVPDTLDGRFAVLATLVSLIMVRLEREGPEGEAASVALTERFVDSLDAELRELGLGDPALGKQVRKLIGAVSGRVGRWRTLVGSAEAWEEEVRRSLGLDQPPHSPGITRNTNALRELWQRLSNASVGELTEGTLE
jgi:cytochrome b pre-mRNA-processing protein 3